MGQESPKHGKHPKGHKPREKEASSGEIAVGGKSGCVCAHGQVILPLNVPVRPRVKLRQQSSGSEDTAREDKAKRPIAVWRNQ